MKLIEYIFGNLHTGCPRLLSEIKSGKINVTPRATLTHLSCSPNFPSASYLDERTLTYEPIFK